MATISIDFERRRVSGRSSFGKKPDTGNARELTRRFSPVVAKANWCLARGDEMYLSDSPLRRVAIELQRSRRCVWTIRWPDNESRFARIAQPVISALSTFTVPAG